MTKQDTGNFCDQNNCAMEIKAQFKHVSSIRRLKYMSFKITVAQ